MALELRWSAAARLPISRLALRRINHLNHVAETSVDAAMTGYQAYPLKSSSAPSPVSTTLLLWRVY